MNNTKRLILVVLTIVFSAIVVLGVSGCSSDEPADDDTTTEEATEAEDTTTEETTEEVDPGRQLVEVKCSMCHSTDRVWAAEYDRETWIATVDRMQNNGLVLSDEEYDQIIDYLAGE